MAFALSRRAILFGLGAVGIAGLGGAHIASGERDLVASMLRCLVGEFRMPEADLAAFANDFKASIGRRSTMLLLLGERTEATQMLIESAPGAIGAKLETLERKLLTSFVMSTTYLQVANRVTEPTYKGLMDGCSNPFARLDQSS